MSSSSSPKQDAVTLRAPKVPPSTPTVPHSPVHRNLSLQRLMNMQLHVTDIDEEDEEAVGLGDSIATISGPISLPAAVGVKPSVLNDAVSNLASVSTLSSSEPRLARTLSDGSISSKTPHVSNLDASLRDRIVSIDDDDDKNLGNKIELGTPPGLRKWTPVHNLVKVYSSSGVGLDDDDEGDLGDAIINAYAHGIETVSGVVPSSGYSRPTGISLAGNKGGSSYKFASIDEEEEPEDIDTSYTDKNNRVSLVTRTSKTKSPYKIDGDDGEDGEDDGRSVPSLDLSSWKAKKLVITESNDDPDGFGNCYRYDAPVPMNPEYDESCSSKSISGSMPENESSVSTQSLSSIIRLSVPASSPVASNKQVPNPTNNPSQASSTSGTPGPAKKLAQGSVTGSPMNQQPKPVQPMQPIPIASTSAPNKPDETSTSTTATSSSQKHRPWFRTRDIPLLPPLLKRLYHTMSGMTLASPASPSATSIPSSGAPGDHDQANAGGAKKPPTMKHKWISHQQHKQTACTSSSNPTLSVTKNASNKDVDVHDTKHDTIQYQHALPSTATIRVTSKDDIRASIASNTSTHAQHNDKSGVWDKALNMVNDKVGMDMQLSTQTLNIDSIAQTSSLQVNQVAIPPSHDTKNNLTDSSSNEDLHLDAHSLNEKRVFMSQYRVTKHLGSGGHSTVRLCTRLTDGELVVCKFVNAASVWHWYDEEGEWNHAHDANAGIDARDSVGSKHGTREVPRGGVIGRLRGAYGEMMAGSTSRHYGSSPVMSTTRSATISPKHTRKIPLEIHMMRQFTRVNTPGLIRYLDHFEIGSRFVIVMEYLGLDWIDLYDYIELYGPVVEPHARDIFKQVVETVSWMHRMGYCHNDIKDENIMVNTVTRETKLIDFGSTTRLEKGKPVTVFYGTKKFAAPEAVQGKCYFSDAHEVWALGTLLYVILFKMDPFKSDDEVVGLDIEKRIQRLKNPAMYGKNPSSAIVVSDKAVRLLVALMQKDYRKRPAIEDVLGFEFFMEDSI